MNSLRNEKMGKRITVSLFCPGPVFTNFLQESFTDKPGEVSTLYLFLERIDNLDNCKNSNSTYYQGHSDACSFSK